MRVWYSGALTYFPALKSGDVAHAFGISEVIETKNSSYRVGDILFGNVGIQEYSIADEGRLMYLI